ncbi:GtrA family protein [Schumannella sp. 10F1B-5-1]|uniref:GtrA family protein n=1 Tax=Schumannella sp. 10F1B-5-1 TaxID=2590780 RepID=UPI0011310C06|nr:GtrA family protein [Schumannella sp. 10F1B-5-1]TPW73555.1 GtrA family protein [Schumannella sp. 10F1B-5-1]
MRRLISQLLRFGLVGGVGFVIDVGLFNLLIATVLHPAQLHEGPLIAKAISTTVAIVANWLGNRFWTFREHRGHRVWREGLQFGVVSVGGLLIGLACLWVSRYALGFDSVVADNVAGNGIGLVLGTVFRFWLYRVWVFAPHTPAEAIEDATVTDSAPTDPAATPAPRRAPRAPRSAAASAPAAVAPRPD